MKDVEERDVCFEANPLTLLLSVGNGDGGPDVKGLLGSLPIIEEDSPCGCPSTLSGGPMLDEACLCSTHLGLSCLSR